MVDTRLLWISGGWSASPPSIPDPDRALIVDSFLLDNGRVEALECHARRFENSCRESDLAIGAEEITAFWSEAQAVLPEQGTWFPRVEAHGGDPAPLVCWIRPAPALTTSIRLWVPLTSDPRRSPRIKGPDIPVLAALRADAVAHGADDAVLIDDAGTVREAAHSALLWWRDDQLCYPSPPIPVLPSITAQRVRALAVAAGHTLSPERVSWTDLTGLEVWAVNALHGIRPVTGWREGDRQIDSPAADPVRLDLFRGLLSRRPISTAS